MQKDELRGVNLQLRRVGPGRLLELEELFMEEPELHYIAARLVEPDAGKILRRLARYQSVLVWDIIPDAYGVSVGYATLCKTTEASPCITVFFFDENSFSSQIAVDAAVLLACRHFENADGSFIHFIAPKPMNADFAKKLIAAGFDEFEVRQTDPEIEATFRMFRHTYDSYYGLRENSED